MVTVGPLSREADDLRKKVYVFTERAESSLSTLELCPTLPARLACLMTAAQYVLVLAENILYPQNPTSSMVMTL